MSSVICRSAAGLIVVGALFTFTVETQAAEVCDLSFTGNLHLRNVPVARTKELQVKGLSNRDDAGQGMLFVFDPPDNLAFWTRDTRIPLSIAFLSEDGILFQLEDMKLASDQYHLSLKPAKYALELAQGQFQQKGFSVGSRLLKQECWFTQ